MRHRPDSRARLANLTPGRRPRQLADGDEPAQDDGWGWPRSTAHPRGSSDGGGGGWVPDSDPSTPAVVSELFAQPAEPPLHRPTGRAPGRHFQQFLDPTDQPIPGPAPQRPPELPEAPPEPMVGRFEPTDDRPRPSAEPPEPSESGQERQTDVVAGHRARRVRYSPHHAWGRVAQRWVPEPLRDARVDPGRRGALLLMVVAAVAALVAAVGVWRDQPKPVPVQAVSLAQVSDATGTVGGPAPAGRTTNSLRPAMATKKPLATGTAVGGSAAGGAAVGGAAVDDAAGSSERTTAGAELVVSVTGAVRHPGLVRLPPGSRVADAIGKAGGTTAAADLTGLNLAARLTDGVSVVVSDQPTGAGSSVSGSDAGALGSRSTATTAPAGRVDLNTADEASLDALPGVGPVTAAAIVAWREKNGRYTSVEQLQEIQGIGPAKYAALAALVRV